MKSYNLNTTGGRIKYLREKHKLTQKKLAEFLNVTPGTVSKWEKEENLPNDHLSRLAEIFGVTVDFLLGRQPIPNNSISTNRKTIEYLEHFEVPGSIFVFAEIWKNSIEGDGFYQLWLYDMFYKYKQLTIEISVKNTTPQILKEKFLSNKLKYLTQYRETLDNAGLSHLASEDRAFLEGAEEFAEYMDIIEQDLGL